MAKTIFYAWQSDRPHTTCRSFIEKCLLDALKSLNGSVEVSPAQRDEELILDKDTKGLPGSPNIAESILAKIDNCTAMVADLTFVAEFKRADDRARFTPNANVLLEYGYALKAKGKECLIGVFNTYYGDIEALPFDLRHRRSAIPYSLSPDADVTTRKEVFKELSEDLRKALQLIIESNITGVATHRIWASDFSEEASSSFLKSGEKLGVRDGNFAAPIEVGLSSKAACWLRVIPPVGTPVLTRTETKGLVRNFLPPMFGGSDSADFGRNRFGAFSYSYSDKEPDVAISIGQLFTSKEIWGIDTLTLDYVRYKSFSGVDFPYIPTGAFERRFLQSLNAYLNFMAAKLGHTGKVKVICGVAGIEGYRLAVSQRRFIEQFLGHSIESTIVHQAELDAPDVSQSENVLLPFFEQVWDAAGVERPKGMSIGGD